MPRREEKNEVSQAAAAQLREGALSEAKDILASPQVHLGMKKAAAQKLYQTALKLAEVELAKEEDSVDAD